MRAFSQRFNILVAQPRFRVLFFLNLLLGFAYSFVAPFMSMFGIQEIGMSKLQFGIFMTCSAVGGVAIGTLLARYSDTHFSRRAMMLLGSVAGCIGYASYAYLQNFLALTLVGMFVIALSTITFAQLFAYAREVLKTADIDESAQVFYMNIFRMYFALAWTIGPAVAAWVMVRFSIRGVFVCAALNFTLFAAVVAKYIPYAPPPFAPQAARIAKSRWWLLQRMDLLAHLAAITLIYATVTMCMANLPLYILETLHGSKADVGFAYSIAPVFELPLMVYFGWLAMHRDSTGILRSGMLVAMAYYGFLCIVGQPWQVFLCQILSAAMVAIIFGVAITYFQSHLPHHPGTATNLYANANRIGSTAGYFLFGTVAAQYGYRAVFMVCVLFAFLGFLLMLVPVRVPEKEAVA